MFEIRNNEKNKSAVILNPERSEWVSRSHVTSVESVVSDRAKTKRYSAKGDLYGDFAYAQPLKMTMISCFALLFTIATTTESWAATTQEQKCGADCYWKIEGDTLTITGSGKMSNYNTTDNRAPWHNTENFTQVKNVVIDGITSVGHSAFWSTSITKLTMSDTVTDIKGEAFAWSRSLTDIKLSDSLKNLGTSAFRGIRLPEITLPADVSIGRDALGEFEPKIVCKGNTEECKKLYEQLKNYV